MNKKGFTLVELIAVMVVLSVIMVISIPNVVAMLDKQKKNTYISDAKKLVSKVKTEIRSNDNIAWPNTTNPITIIYLNDVYDGDIKKDPEGNSYSLTKSFVAITKEAVSGMAGTYDYVYYVMLIGENATDPTKNRGIDIVKSSVLSTENASTYVLKNINTYATPVDIANKILNSTTITLDKINLYN
ncbi:MAG: type II secretion system protein [Bacilli bacterium]|nr:type II secretion system protein [Bacilli bacterium]